MTVVFMSIVAPSFLFPFITASRLLNPARQSTAVSKVNSQRFRLIRLGVVCLSLLAGVGQAATPAVWFRADAIIGLSSGGKLSVWNDSSGNGLNASQSNPIQQPTFVTNAMNGLPVVRINGANSTMLAFNRPAQDDFTITCVFQSIQGLWSGSRFYQGAGRVNGEVPGVMDDFGPCLFANAQLRMN